jgi:hypothetical protein
MDGPTPRIVKETNGLKTETVAGIKCEVDPNNFRHFFVKIDSMIRFTQDLKKLAMKMESLMQNYYCQMTIL